MNIFFFSDLNWNNFNNSIAYSSRSVVLSEKKYQKLLLTGTITINIIQKEEKEKIWKVLECPRMFLKRRCLDAAQRGLATAGTSIGTLVPQKPTWCLQVKGSFRVFSAASQLCCAEEGVSPGWVFGACAAPAPLSSCKASPRDSRVPGELIPLRRSSLSGMLWARLEGSGSCWSQQGCECSGHTQGMLLQPQLLPASALRQREPRGRLVQNGLK